MRPWWEQWEGRLEVELERFDHHGLAFEVDAAERDRGRIVLSGRAPIAPGEETRLIIVYPDTYPSTRVAVYAPDLVGTLDRHQAPFNGNLCVLPRASEYWRPSVLAADLVAEVVPELVALVRAGGDELRQAEDPQGEPFTDYLPFIRTGGILVPAPALRLSAHTETGLLRIRFRDSSDWLENPEGQSPPVLGRALLELVSDRRDGVLSTADPHLSDTFAGRRWHGRWVRLARPPSSPDPIRILEEAADANDWIRQRAFRNRGASRQFEVIGVVFPEEVRQGEWEDAWFFVVARAKRGKKARQFEACLVRGMRYTEEDVAARIPELAELPHRTVGQVGLGAIGAPIALELGRAQLGRLRLLDGDYVDAGQGVRWPWGLEAAGTEKVQFLQGTLARNYPYTKVEAIRHHVGAVSLDREKGLSEREVLDRWSSGADLLVDATAEDNVSRVIAYLAHPSGIPQLYVWSVDGFGGVIACLVPGKTGCFLCLERALADGGTISPPPAAASGESLRLQPRGCADPTFSAAAPDLTALSNQSARMAFGLLCAGRPGGYPSTDHDVLTLKMREPGGAPTVPTWTGWTLPADSACELCALVA